MKKAILLICLLAGIGWSIQELQRRSEIADNPFHEKSPAEVVSLARDLDVRSAGIEASSKTRVNLIDDKDFSRARNALLDVRKNDPQFDDAQRLLLSLQRHKDEGKRRAEGIVREARENNIEGRKQFAKSLEQENLKAGRDVQISISGPKNATLKFQYVLVNRPFVYKMQNETRFLQNATEAGFTKVIFSNGYDDEWTFNLKP